MSVEPGPYVAKSMPLILRPSGALAPRPMTPTFYQDLGAEFSDFAGHVLISCHSFDADWPSWEVHPNGDEFVMLMSGDTEFVLWQDNREQLLRVSEPGTYVVVPKGTWHTARPKQPTTMLFVTPGEGTLNAERPG